MGHRALRIMTLLAASGLLAACDGGSDSAGTSSTSTASTATEHTVYLADQDINEVFELYWVSPTSGSSVKLNPALPNGRNVTDFKITPDRTAVVYRADQDTDETYELYRVEFSHPGTSTKLNAALPAGGDVEFEFRITGTSSSVLYLAEGNTDGVLELYHTAFATPGISTKLNGPLTAGGNVFFGFEIAPDNTFAVYRATETTANTIELYRVSLATPGISTKLNGTLPSNADVDFLKIAPDSASVVYDVAEPPPNVKSELYWSHFSGPGQGTKLSAPLSTVGGIVEAFISGAFAIAPDNSSVVYMTHSQTGDFRFLYRVPFATPGQGTKLNGAAGDPYVLSFAIRPDSSGVVYTTNPNGTVGRLRGTELFLSTFNAPGPSVKLNGALVPNGGLADNGGDAFTITPDNTAVVYAADQTTDQVVELYRVPFASPGNSITLNGPLVAGGNVYSFPGRGPRVASDSASVLYRADGTTAGVSELYRVAVAAPGGSIKQNSPLVTGGNVEAFAID